METLPKPVTEVETVQRRWNVAVNDFALFITKTTEVVVAVEAPDQPVNVQPAEGVAETVTDSPGR